MNRKIKSTKPKVKGKSRSHDLQLRPRSTPVRVHKAIGSGKDNAVNAQRKVNTSPSSKKSTPVNFKPSPSFSSRRKQSKSDVSTISSLQLSPSPTPSATYTSVSQRTSKPRTSVGSVNSNYYGSTNTRKEIAKREVVEEKLRTTTTYLNTIQEVAVRQQQEIFPELEEMHKDISDLKEASEHQLQLEDESTKTMEFLNKKLNSLFNTYHSDYDSLKQQFQEDLAEMQNGFNIKLQQAASERELLKKLFEDVEYKDIERRKSILLEINNMNDNNDKTNKMLFNIKEEMKQLRTNMCNDKADFITKLSMLETSIFNVDREILKVKLASDSKSGHSTNTKMVNQRVADLYSEMEAMKSLLNKSQSAYRSELNLYESKLRTLNTEFNEFKHEMSIEVHQVMQNCNNNKQQLRVDFKKWIQANNEP